MTQEKIIEGNKLIAEFMGYKYPYKMGIWRGGYALENVDFFSKIKLPLLADVHKDFKEHEPSITDGYVRASKYGLKKLYDNIVWFDTTTDKIPATLEGFNNVAAQYHSNWNWLMDVVEKIEMLGYSVEIFKSASHNEPDKIWHRCVIEKMTNWNIELLSGEEDDNTGKQYIKSHDKKESTFKAVVDFIKWYNENI